MKSEVERTKSRRSASEHVSEVDEVGGALECGEVAINIEALGRKGLEATLVGNALMEEVGH